MKSHLDHLRDALNEIEDYISRVTRGASLRKARWCTHVAEDDPTWDGYASVGEYGVFPMFTFEQAQAILKHYGYKTRYDGVRDILYYRHEDSDLDEDYEADGVWALVDGELLHLFWVGNQDDWTWDEVKEAGTDAK